MQRICPALQHLFAAAGLPQQARKTVRLHLSGAARPYHGLRHVALLWTRHRRFAAGTPFAAPQATRLIACAIAFHDVIYDPRRRDNERCSARLWRHNAPPGLCPADIDWVASAIEATADHLAPYPTGSPRERLLLWMLDLDLTPLGEPAPLFTRNSRDLRIEYRHLPKADWERNRQSFMRKLQAAPRLFRYRPLAIRFEAAARRNVARALAEAGSRPASGSAMRP